MSFGSDFSQFRKGIKFLSGFLSSPEYGLKSYETNLKSVLFQNKNYRMKIFHPKSYKKGKMQAILILHGMSVMGIEDPRVINVATSLSKCGYIVFMPELLEVKGLNIQKESIDNIYDLAFSILKIKSEYGFSKLGFFSISFTGGMGLISMSRQGLEGVSSIAVVGPYGNFSNTLPFVLNHFEDDTYGTFVLMYNFIENVYESSENLKEIFFESAVDNGLKRNGDKSVAPKIKEKLNTKEREIYENILNDLKFRLEIAEKIKNSIGSLMDELSPINYIENIKSPIAILHGKNDYVIPESESIDLAKKLKLQGMNHLLEITGLLSHGDSVAAVKQVPYIYGFAKTFGYFLENIQV